MNHDDVVSMKTSITRMEAIEIALFEMKRCVISLETVRTHVG